MKAIIPVAGAGTKLRPHTYTQPKALIPLAGKTILSIIIDQLVEAGIREYVLIVGYLGDKIQDYVKLKYPDLEFHFVHQNERFGLGHAIYLTRNIVGSDEVFIALGDTICEYDVKAFLAQPGAVLGVVLIGSPDLAEELAADLLLARLTVGHDAAGGRKDRDAHAASDARDAVVADVDALTGA